MDDLQTVSGIGKQIHIKLQEIFETGALKTAEKIKQNSEVRMYDELLKILSKNSSYIKRELVKVVQIRKVPELIFKSDTSLENYNKLDEILHEESKKFIDK